MAQQYNTDKRRIDAIKIRSCNRNQFMLKAWHYRRFKQIPTNCDGCDIVGCRRLCPCGEVDTVGELQAQQFQRLPIGYPGRATMAFSYAYTEAVGQYAACSFVTRFDL